MMFGGNSGMLHTTAQGCTHAPWLLHTGLLGTQGAFGGGMPSMMGMDPQQLSQMMNSPIVQNLLENPEFLRSMMQSNPALRQVHLCIANLPSPVSCAEVPASCSTQPT